MPDMENVIKWLDVCKTSHYAVGIKEDYPCRLCPYHEKEYCMKQLITDALALLKEQEVVPVLIREGKSKMYNDYRCPRCDQEIVYEQNYCSECGSVVKWE